MRQKEEAQEEKTKPGHCVKRSYTRTEELYYSENEHDQGGHWKSKKRRLPPIVTDCSGYSGWIATLILSATLFLWAMRWDRLDFPETQTADDTIVWRRRSNNHEVHQGAR
nr:hypothetical protein [Tanacetum cinerariifolium]